MKKMIVSLLMLAQCGNVALFAQEQDEAKENKRIEKMTTRIIERINIQEENKPWFTQTYTTYLKALEEIRKMYPMPNNKPTDENEMRQSIENSLKRTEAELNVKRTFIALFSEKLTASQLYDLFVPTRRMPSRMNGGNRPQMPNMGGMPPMGEF